MVCHLKIDVGAKIFAVTAMSFPLLTKRLFSPEMADRHDTTVQRKVVPIISVK